MAITPTVMVGFKCLQLVLVLLTLISNAPFDVFLHVLLYNCMVLGIALQICYIQSMAEAQTFVMQDISVLLTLMFVIYSGFLGVQLYYNYSQTEIHAAELEIEVSESEEELCGQADEFFYCTKDSNATQYSPSDFQDYLRHDMLVTFNRDTNE